jgi:hypothetical protein
MPASEDRPGFFECLITGSRASCVISAFSRDPRPLLLRVALWIAHTQALSEGNLS